MTRQEQLEYCSVCKNRAFNPKHGIVCGLTNEVATFSGSCPDFSEDKEEAAGKARAKKVQQTETNKGINKGRYALFIVGGLYVITGILEAYVIAGHDLLFGIVDWIIAGVFIGLGVWSFYKASLSMIIGLSFYILLMLLLAAIEPTTLIRGVIWKILVIFYLIYGIRTAREAESKVKTKQEDLLDQI